MYSMNDGLAVAHRATSDITAWLLRQSATVAVKNVENDPRFQRLDIDLLWQTRGATYSVEIKGDRLHQTGNFFFETVSNRERGTPGCFLYTEANYLFYYFVRTHTLYILPMPQTRDWFRANLQGFRERATRTPVGQTYYTTVGRLVPIGAVLRGVPQVRQVHI